MGAITLFFINVIVILFQGLVHFPSRYIFYKFLNCFCRKSLLIFFISVSSKWRHWIAIRVLMLSTALLIHVVFSLALFDLPYWSCIAVYVCWLAYEFAHLVPYDCSMNT